LDSSKVIALKDGYKNDIYWMNKDLEKYKDEVKESTKFWINSRINMLEYVIQDLEELLK